MKRAIFDRVPFRSVNRIRGGAADVDGEIARYSALLREQPADVVFMGIGENGHIAFNDPHVAHFDDDCLMRAVELDETCRRQQVNDGCFAALDQVPTHALTLTIPALVSAERLFCMVPAATKADAVGKTVLGEIRETLPATILRAASAGYPVHRSGQRPGCAGCLGNKISAHKESGSRLTMAPALY